MSFIPPWLAEVIWEKKRYFRDFLWELDMTIPAGQTIVARVVLPDNEVWWERGYEFEPDKLNVIRFSHWHDGLPQMINILLTESILSWRYTKPEIVRSNFVVQVTNIDTVDHYLHVKGLYRAMPREEFNKLLKVV